MPGTKERRTVRAQGAEHLQQQQRRRRLPVICNSFHCSVLLLLHSTTPPPTRLLLLRRHDGDSTLPGKQHARPPLPYQNSQNIPAPFFRVRVS